MGDSTSGSDWERYVRPLDEAGKLAVAAVVMGIEQNLHEADGRAQRTEFVHDLVHDAAESYGSLVIAFALTSDICSVLTVLNEVEDYHYRLYKDSGIWTFEMKETEPEREGSFKSGLQAALRSVCTLSSFLDEITTSVAASGIPDDGQMSGPLKEQYEAWTLTAPLGCLGLNCLAYIAAGVSDAFVDEAVADVRA